MIRTQILIACCLFAAFSGTARGQQEKLLCGFEGTTPPNTFEYNTGQPRLVREGVTQGETALELTFDAGSRSWGAYLVSFRLPHDWSEYDALLLDVLNANDEPMPASVLVGDKAWQDNGGTYWNRHNGGRTFPPGRTTWTLPLKGLYRGEAGSRNNDIKRNIDPDSIVRLDLGFGKQGAAGRVIIDNLRLVKNQVPERLWAFDFGPDSQSLMLGWTPITSSTQYSPETGYGWGPRGGTPWPGSARDTTFGTALLQDFCEAGGYNFHIDAPRGNYDVTVIYENSGYWGGEQSRHSRRRILANGREVWTEQRPDGPAHALFRFEQVEPVGVDIWDAYMQTELAQPIRFPVVCGNDGLTLRFEADGSWGSKLAALAVVPQDDSQAVRWLEKQLQSVAEEFRGKAICLDPPAEPIDVPAPWQTAGLMAWNVPIEAELSPSAMPSEPQGLADTPATLAISRTAVQDEFEPFCLAVRPLCDFGDCRLELTPFQGPGPLPAEVQVVWYNTSRGFGTIAYRIRPHSVRSASQVNLPRDVTRQLIVTARTSADTAPGQYRAELRVRNAADQVVLRVPLQLDVRPIVLNRQTDYQMGFFGLMPPGNFDEQQRWKVLPQTLALLREHGMNAVSGGPSWTLKGWQGGKPDIDFGDMDRFFALLREHGFAGPINGYGGLRFRELHDQYTVGQTGARVAQASGLPFDKALVEAWRAVDQHARSANWPVIYYAMCDETRVREQAERELEFMQAMRGVTRLFPETVRSSGSYSVQFRTRPSDRDDLLYWHQQFFAALDINSLNSHDESVMSEAKKLGCDIHIYNQGLSRYSFGLYQWSEYQKGVRARWQWHLSALHGYQFFDLDGREPDTAAICYGRDTLYPTLALERCREGAEDFYLYSTLAQRIDQLERAGVSSDSVTKAKRLLKQLVDSVQLNQREEPPDYDADAMKLKVIAALESVAGL